MTEVHVENIYWKDEDDQEITESTRIKLGLPYEETLELDDETIAADVDGWDSHMHISLIDAVEEEFDIRFDMKTVVKMKNVGEMVDVIESQV